MSTTPQPGTLDQPQAAPQDLTVRPLPLREFNFIYESSDNQRLRSMFGAGAVGHLTVLLLFLLLAAVLPKRVYEAVLPDRLSDKIVWLAQPGPGGGGGGGGEKIPQPPKKVEVVGQKKISVPATPPPEPKPEPAKPEPPELQLNIPAQTLAAAAQTSPGVIESNSNTGGAGTGPGTGAGQGTGSGLGPGFGGGTGGGAYRPGNGVQLPRVLREVRPNYTSEAMRAKVQGTVLLECVVMPDGTVGTVEVVRSLDANFGLDQEAIKAAKQWRFAPGTRFGEPVPVLITIELTFTLR